MFRDENHPPVDFASLPRLHIKRHFKRQSPVTVEELNSLVRVVKPLSERFAACRKGTRQHEGPANYNNEQFLSRPSLCVTLAVVNDDVCRVQVEEDWRRESDVLHNENFDISQTMVVGKQVFGKSRNVIIGSKSRLNRSDSTNVVGLEEFPSVETSSDMSLCSDDDVEDTSVVVVPQKVGSWQSSSGSVLESENMEKRGKKRREKNALNSLRNATLEGVLVDQLSSESEFGALMATSRENHHLKALSPYQQQVDWQFPAISETVVPNFDSIDYYSNAGSDGKAPNLGRSVQSSWASVVNSQGMDSMEQMVGDNYKRNADKNDLSKYGLESQKHKTFEYQFSELPERDNRNKSFNQWGEVEGRLKTKHGKDEGKHRSDQKQQLEVGDEDLLNEGWMELEKVYKRRTEHHTDEKQQKKLENTQSFHGRAIVPGRCEQPLFIPLENVSNEKHYRWKEDGQLVSYMKDPRLERHMGQKKENPAQSGLIPVSYARRFRPAGTIDTNIFIKSESIVDGYESTETMSKTPSNTSCSQHHSEKARCHGTNSIPYKSRDATDKPISLVPRNVVSIQDLVTANEYLPVCADGKTVENVRCGACPIPVVLSQAFFSYVENQSGGGPDDSEPDQNVLPPDWMDEPSPETRQGRSSCGYVNEMLRNIYRCITDARVISDAVYRDTMLMESLQCIKLALNIHSKL